MLSWLWGRREKGREKKEQKNEKKEREKTDGHKEMKIRMVSYFFFLGHLEKYQYYLFLASMKEFMGWAKRR